MSNPTSREHPTAPVDGPDELLSRLEAGETVVLNIRTHGALIKAASAAGRYVRIDRRSRWGNPYRMRSEADRAEVIEAYRRALDKSPVLYSAIRQLRGKALGCWCAPKPCHGDVLAAAAQELEA